MDLNLEKNIKAPQEKCFRAFTEPEHLSKWFTTNAKAELKVGGKYSNDDNDQGEFLELNPNSNVNFTWDNKDHCPGTEVSVYFHPLAENETKISLSHTKLESLNHLEEMKKGWTWALESIRSYLEEGKPLPYSEWEKSLQK